MSELADALPEKQRRFVETYFSMPDPNGKKAAIKAGYSRKTAESQASRLLRNVKVAAYLGELRDARSEQAKVDGAWVLEQLVELYSADILEVFDDDGKVRKLSEIPEHTRKLIAGLKIVKRRNGEESVETTEVKLSERLKVLDMIGKHTGAWRDKDEGDRVLLVLRDFTGREHQRPVG